MFTQLFTDRLLIRPLVATDAAGWAQRRNEPAVAEYLTYTLPYTMEKAEAMVADAIALGGPTDGEWWNAAVCDRTTGEVRGDVGVGLSWSGRTAEIGYVFGTAQWGHGYAGEAVEALVQYLFVDLAVTRVFGMLHPDNPASAMVLERAGLLFEGHTRSSFWVGDVNSDDWIYGATRPDWETWRDRPRHPPTDVSLIEVTDANAGEVRALTTHKSQERFVAPMLDSFADALIPEIVDGAPVVPWLRAVVADDDIVGFVMLALRTEHHPEPYLWRLLVDRLHQRRGIGDRILDLVAAECRATGATSLLTSWVEAKGSPRQFYLRQGFEPTGRIVDGETEARKQL